jgi:hypothetical protein
MTRVPTFVLALALAAAATVAAAQAPATRIRGQIQSLDGQTLTIKPRAGGELVLVKLADNFGVTGVVPMTIVDIVPGKFVGTASLPQPDGSLKAIEVLIFPDAMRGSGEGHYPWDLAPQSMMTNANVAEVESVSGGRSMLLRYKDGEKRVVVPEGAPIVTFVPADRSALVAGAHVLVGAQRQADGTLTAARVTVGLNGLMPPM